MVQRRERIWVDLRTRAKIGRCQEPTSLRSWGGAAGNFSIRKDDPARRAGALERAPTKPFVSDVPSSLFCKETPSHRRRCHYSKAPTRG